MVLFNLRKVCTSLYEASSGQLTWIWFGMNVIFAVTYSTPLCLYISLARTRQGWFGIVVMKIGGMRSWWGANDYKSKSWVCDWSSRTMLEPDCDESESSDELGSEFAFLDISVVCLSGDFISDRCWSCPDFWWVIGCMRIQRQYFWVSSRGFYPWLGSKAD